ncbi:peptide ligase PGM1-related protein [Streptomyces beijiangensis]|uniref:ATP-grasp domain-containing protein n=1 Tax=Streptomyces beijiangensis TaxID=163361 RepID=A0A939FEG1_9ACTN|nr:peptide ligase PGM1-related protein [Streptomyces beijiangensis]MBO0517102.1 hypothetical protein [Streptomyces beijiangensis]
MHQRKDEAAPLIFLANFASPVAVGLHDENILRAWSAQAPRELWLMSPGDILLTPAPASDEFRAYTAGLLGMDADAVTVVDVPPEAGIPMGEAVMRPALLEPLRSAVRHHPGYRLLPTALDEASVALARELGVAVHPFPPDADYSGALAAVDALNTKSEFRAVATQLGMRLPAGCTCGSSLMPRAADEFARSFGRAVVKPDRSAGGHGLRFVDKDDPVLDVPAGTGQWVVEEYVPHKESISAQCVCGPTGPRTVFTGRMTVSRGEFTGYRAPLTGISGAALAQFEEWCLTFGRHLAGLGYLGPYSLDALLTEAGDICVTESNVRRTATTTPHAAISRLASTLRIHPSAWALGSGRSAANLTLSEALERLSRADIAFPTGRGDGVVLLTGHESPAEPWRYVLFAADAGRLDGLQEGLTTALALS